MLSLDLVQLLMFGLVNRLVPVGLFLGSVQDQCPFLEDSILVVVLQADDWFQDNIEGPAAMGHLGPGVGCHEGPASESVLAVIVVGSLAQDHRSVDREG